MNYVLDTNVVIYLQKGLLAQSLPHGYYFISVITEIELLSFPDLTADQEQGLRQLLADVTVVGLDEDVKIRTIEVRRVFRLRMPDAIVAASAMSLHAELLTNDTAFAPVDTLRSRPVALKPSG